jgi:4-amino-4-deoxy-L-arabinose transferase-like glycosyltransferase
MKTAPLIKNFIKTYPLIIVSLFFISSRICTYLLTSFGWNLCSDSHDYVDLAKRLLNFNLKGYWFERTPGYPLLIALANMHLYRLALIQVGLSFLTVLLFYKIAAKTVNTFQAILLAILPCVVINFHFYEIMILSENLAVFLLTSICYVFYCKEQKYISLFLIGLLSALLLLTRTIFIYITPILALVYLLENQRDSLKRKIISVLNLTIPTLIVFLLWSSLNKQHTGYFTLTNYLGINLAQTSVRFYESDSTDNSLIKKIYVKHIHIAEKDKTKEIKNAIWDAYDELLEKTRMDLPDLSNELKKKSIQLIINNKILYVKQAAISWTEFWTNKMYCIFVDTRFMSKNLYLYWRTTSHILQLTFNFLFILATLFFSKRFLINKEKIPFQVYTSILIVILGSLLQAIIIYGDNPRFSFPYYPLIYLVVFFFFKKIINRVRNKYQNKINVSE